jgi:peptide/nickel transport system permease protein
MLAFTLRRLAWAVVILFIASLGVFFLVSQSGNPLALLRANPKIPPAVIAQRAAQLHLNDPFFTRYWIWLRGVLHGNFGTRVDGNPVGPQLWSHLWITLRMVIPATVIAVFVAIGLGVWAAMRQGRMADIVITTSNFVLISVPVFVLGLVLKDFVAIPINKHVGHTIFYTVGEQSATLSGGFFSRLPDYAAHTALPVITLVLVSYPFWTIYQRSSMLEVLDSDYVRLARAKGLNPRRVLVRHILRNALLPVTTVIALDFAAILGGALVTEIVFDWDGIGQWGFAGVESLDFNTVQAYLLVTAFFVIIFNLFADVLYGILDPRIRLA